MLYCCAVRNLERQTRYIRICGYETRGRITLVQSRLEEKIEWYIRARRYANKKKKKKYRRKEKRRAVII